MFKYFMTYSKRNFDILQRGIMHKIIKWKQYMVILYSTLYFKYTSGSLNEEVYQIKAWILLIYLN